MRKAAIPATTTSAAPREGGAALDLFERLAAPFGADEVKTRQGPRGPLRYIDARAARRRLNEVLGPENWEVELAPAEHWVLCRLTITLPDGRRVARSALGGYPDGLSEEDKYKAGDSDAFKRACATFGIASYLGDPDHTESTPTPTSNGNGRGELRNVPRDRISFSNARSFYGWLRDNKYLPLAEEIGNREFFPPKFVDYSPAQIDATVQEILDRTSRTGGGR